MTVKTNPNPVRKTLGLTGITINAMALTAPGAFLWLLYQVQAAASFRWRCGYLAWGFVGFAVCLAYGPIVWRTGSSLSRSGFPQRLSFCRSFLCPPEKSPPQNSGAHCQVCNRLDRPSLLLDLSRVS